MNIFKAELDTIHQNGVIGPITQFDNATLELQILTGGQVGESWNSPEFELIAMKRDMNPVREVDQDKFTILSNEAHTVRIELKEQFLTCRGTVKMQLVIKDGSRTSTTVFRLSVGQSLDHDIITSIRDVEVLDQLDLYVAQGFSAINEATEITGELKKEMTEINNEASRFEKERQASELTRNQRELVRVDNEEDRVANELGRIQNEEMRVANEEERVENENTRITNENNRRIHENTRITQEAARQEAERQRNAIFEENENIRSEQENTRIKSENERKKKFTAWEDRETIRLKSEENRILQERERVENEENRKRQELTRQNQEEYRQRTYTQFNEAEASRIAKESQRESAEQQRQQSENERDAAYQRREENRDVEYGKAEEVRNNAFEQNEANRQNEYTVAERDRVESEELRKGRERDRANAETKRQEAETARANAESGRVDRFNKEIEKAKTTMATATSNVNTAISQADATMQGIEKRAEDCLPAIEKSASAKVDYMGNQHESIKDAMDANVEFVLDEVNTVHYGGQTITATDTIERQVKQAELKGCTLVNHVMTDMCITIAPGGVETIAQSIKTLKINTEYILIFNMAIGSDTNVILHKFDEKWNFVDNLVTKLSPTKKYIKFSTPSTQIVQLQLQNDGLSSFDVSKIRLIEYQDGMENWNIPYFEGMKSVQMPISKMTGKNLIDFNQIKTNMVALSIEKVENGVKLVTHESLTYRYAYSNAFKVEKGKYYNITYTVENKKKNNRANIAIKGMKGENLTGFWDTAITGDGVATATFLSQYDTDVRVHLYASMRENNSGNAITYTNVIVSEVEEASIVNIPYEPYKSNILHTPEEVVLREVNGVCDTLNLITGEYVQRIGEVVLNGSINSTITEWFDGNWDFAKDVVEIECAVSDMKGYVTTVSTNCDKLNSLPFEEMYRNGSNNVARYPSICAYVNGRLVILLDRSSVSENTLENKKSYLASNPITVQYELGVPIVKTVDLKGQKVYSYDGTTHYTCSAAEGSLVPTLSIDVPTNLPALVSRQRVTIESQKEQIITLEQENEQLIAQNEVQDTDIALNQDAINFMLFAPSVKSISEDKGGVSTMAAYLANQILKGRLDYTLVISRYSEFKEDIDTILIAEGKQDLIK